MGNKYKKSYISLEAAKEKSSIIATIVECIDLANKMAVENGTRKENFDQLIIKMEKRYSLEGIDYKLDLDFKEKIQPSAAMYVRNYLNDRRFKLDTVKINEFSRIHHRDLDEATIHIGMSADEYVRSFNALALTVGKDIYFRNGAYRPETEEGRQLLAHELTHVSQNNNKEEKLSATKEELEQEALIEENLEKYEIDPYVQYVVDGKEYRLRKSQIKKIEQQVCWELEKWVEDQSLILSEEDYYKLLLNYQNYLDHKEWN